MFDVPLATHAAAPIRTKQQIHAASTTSGNEVVDPVGADERLGHVAQEEEAERAGEQQRRRRSTLLDAWPSRPGQADDHEEDVDRRERSAGGRADAVAGGQRAAGGRRRARARRPRSRRPRSPRRCRHAPGVTGGAAAGGAAPPRRTSPSPAGTGSRRARSTRAPTRRSRWRTRPGLRRRRPPGRPPSAARTDVDPARLVPWRPRTTEAASRATTTTAPAPRTPGSRVSPAPDVAAHSVKTASGRQTTASATEMAAPGRSSNAVARRRRPERIEAVMRRLVLRARRGVDPVRPRRPARAPVHARGTPRRARHRR